MLGTAANKDDIEDVRAGLQASTEGVVLALLGEPKVRARSEWRWGSNNGSLAVVMRGAKRGLWCDRASDEGGDLFALIQHRRGGNFARAMKWARSFLAMPATERPKPQPQPSREALQREAHVEEARRLRRAQAFAKSSEPVAGTVAERYLIETRGIPRPASGWPDSVRFHRGRNALLLVATNDAGEVRAVQLVHLTVDAVKRGDEPGRPVKQTFGILKGVIVRLPSFQTLKASAQPTLQLAEGPETGLSVWTSTGRPTWIALGSVTKVQPPALGRLVICSDDDPRSAPAAKAVQKAVARWRSEGCDVVVARPWSRRRFDRSDFNNLIRRDGPAAVVARIELALSPRRPQPPGDAALPVELARYRLKQAVSSFFNAVRGFDPGAAALGGTANEMIVHGVRVGVGLGKSTITRQEAATLLAEMRARGDPRTIIFAVPTHKLGDEQARAFERLAEARAAGLTAGVWRGREAADPSTPGEAMCRDLEAARDARTAGLPVETAVCRQRGKGEGATCPFYGVCGYQAQKKRSHDLWFVPHELLFGKKPAALGKPAVVIVDEAAWAKGLEGVNGHPVEMPLDLLHDAVLLPQDKAGHETARLRHVHGITRAALDGLPDGPLRRDAVLDAGLTCETGQEGHRLSWRRVADPGLVPGQSRDQRRELLAQVRENRNAMRMARFFATLEHLLAHDGPEASGWASLATVEEKDGTSTRVVRLRGRRSVGKDWRVPTLHLDALLSPALLRPYWPEIVVTAEIEGRTPHQRIRQLHGKDWPKSALMPDAWSDAQEGERRLKNSERLRAAVWRLARATNGRVLVVVQKAVEDYWRQAGPIPGNVELAHHNAVAGRDEWGPQPDRDGVVLTIVIGRTLPRPASVEAIAEALTGHALEARASRFDRQDAAIHLADGTAISTEADRHPDPLAEAIRWQICEGELIQIIGRPRGVNRTSANPTDILVLTDRPLPLAIDEAVTWDELAPSAGDLMLAQGGVALVSPSDAARCYPNLWGSTEAAKKAFQRGQWGTFPKEEYSLGECPRLLRATYQKAGERMRPAELLFDPSAVPDLRDWLEERVGPLARLKIEAPPPPPEPSPLRPGPNSSPNGPNPPLGEAPRGRPGPWPSRAVVLRPLDSGSGPPTFEIRNDNLTYGSSTGTTVSEFSLETGKEPVRSSRSTTKSLGAHMVQDPCPDSPTQQNPQSRSCLSATHCISRHREPDKFFSFSNQFDY